MMKLRYSIRLRTDDDKLIKFAEAQDNFNDTVRYLIEKEIAENGIRNLQVIVPSVRDKSYFERIINNTSEVNQVVVFDNVLSTDNDNKKVIDENFYKMKKDIDGNNTDKDIPSCYE